MSAETQKLIVRMLKQKPMTVSELVAATGLSKAGVRYHLNELKPRITTTRRTASQHQIIEGTRK